MRAAVDRIDLDRGGNVESSLFETERESTGPRK